MLIFAVRHPAGEPADGGAVLGVVALVFLFLLIAGKKK